ncbi:shikimate dehydrogenase [Ensifer sp. YR511]|uniref:shikimate dehydrogenase family protein n=1 Tax=Ensifer sp. YR511 TaxID=1855294 RepID=UPI0008865DEE|nr:shikimate dehydrogenase [Ensifer sp. YR511]SDN04375.1 Shikimate 5-dehydrogenase [Ensifer sp. YR511]
MAYAPATGRTIYFIGVSTQRSSIMKVFPAWSDELGLDAEIKGIDFAPSSDPVAYREAVDFIRRDPLSMGALVTTHKVNLLKASRDLFDELDPYAHTLHEISSISKRGNRMIGHAKDPISAGASFEAVVAEGHWGRTGATLCVLGSGGSSLALTLYLHNKNAVGGDVPSKLIITARRAASLEEMQKVHAAIGFSIPIEYRLAATPQEADAVVGSLPAHSLVVNATGLGKDGPGSPLTDAALFPKMGLVWEFNYRGELVFLDQARAAEASRGLTVHDGWVYFIHGWTRVIAEVFDIDIPMSGPAFDRLSQLAKDATS